MVCLRDPQALKMLWVVNSDSVGGYNRFADYTGKVKQQSYIYASQIQFSPWNLRWETRLLWAGMVYTHFFFLKSQMFTVLSSLPVAMWYLEESDKQLQPSTDTESFLYLLGHCTAIKVNNEWGFTHWKRNPQQGHFSSVLRGARYISLIAGPRLSHTHLDH